MLDRLTLMHADFRSFTLETPAALIALPYHSIGHLLTLDDKRDALAQVFSQLRPGGRFVFDDFLVTPDLIEQMRRTQLRAEYQSAAGADTLLWVDVAGRRGGAVDQGRDLGRRARWRRRAGAAMLPPLEPELA